TYLYDDKVLNDVQYIFNRDVLFNRVYPMMTENDKPDFHGGITSFDTYSNWMKRVQFGHKALFPDGITTAEPLAPKELTLNDVELIKSNIQQNVTSLAESYPDISFYYFFTPYSAAWWQSILYDGNLERQIQGERIVIEEILKYDNIHLFSFNCLFDITTDLNNYKDMTHYGEWINSMILRYMHDGTCQITIDNYEQYLNDEYLFYLTYDYSKLTKQDDYENDYYAAALLRSNLYGVKPLIIDLKEGFELSHASIEEAMYDGKPGVVCVGSLQRSSKSEIPLDEYIRDEEYIGIKILLDDVSPYRYLTFYGKKNTDHGQLTFRLYDFDGNLICSHDESYKNLDTEWHQYLIDINQAKGPVILMLNGGYTDSTGSPDSQYVFSNIILY
ncbi:MAG: hypothetical protein K6C08_15600, partial [Oscillospiraceae bacterium]|nr:hypothetical protein [Oscillospiraceae bacterium]